MFEDTVYNQIAEMIENGQKISIPYLQRKFKLSYDKLVEIVSDIKSKQVNSLLLD